MLVLGSLFMLVHPRMDRDFESYKLGSEFSDYQWPC
jgi:hypothetical protein